MLTDFLSNKAFQLWNTILYFYSNQIVHKNFLKNAILVSAVLIQFPQTISGLADSITTIKHLKAFL